MRIDWTHPDVIARFTALHKAGASHAEIRQDPLFKGASKGQLSGGRSRLGLEARDLRDVARKAGQQRPQASIDKMNAGKRAKAAGKVKAPKAAKALASSSDAAFNPGRPIPASPADIAAAKARGMVLTSKFDADTPPPGSRRLLDEGGAQGCRWPVTVDGEAWFCCLPKVSRGKGSYCEGHAARAYVASAPPMGAKSNRAHIAAGGRP
jgi:hypothetical protein